MIPDSLVGKNRIVWSNVSRSVGRMLSDFVVGCFRIHWSSVAGIVNMAEIENNVLVNHGLSKRIPTIEQMRKEVAAWKEARNLTARKINWRFTTDDARIKLKHLYPKFEA